MLKLIENLSLFFSRRETSAESIETSIENTYIDIVDALNTETQANQLRLPDTARKILQTLQLVETQDISHMFGLQPPQYFAHFFEKRMTRTRKKRTPTKQEQNDPETLRTLVEALAKTNQVLIRRTSTDFLTGKTNPRPSMIECVGKLSNGVVGNIRIVFCYGKDRPINIQELECGLSETGTFFSKLQMNTISGAKSFTTLTGTTHERIYNWLTLLHINGEPYHIFCCYEEYNEDHKPKTDRRSDTPQILSNLSPARATI